MVELKQFDVFPNPDADDRAHPFFIVLQADVLTDLRTRVVAPLVTPTDIRTEERLFPKVVVRGGDYLIATPDLGPIPVQVLRPPVANLEADRYRLLNAIDMLFSGI